ncbi:cubilin-like isoform X2 [Montipora foliosa]|uniref:cubilin-like isoform X2 n=1 Tax=Montipora foliosa TaxID=591990 RepID=UPI0035F18776
MRLYVLAHVIVLISVRLILADDDCGSVQNNTLRSPGYPNNYPSNMDCVYRVPIPLDQELEIYFKDFKLENSWNYCPYDYLRISNDRNHIIGTYCGWQTGRRVLITSSAAVLSFHSDGSVQYRGFDLSFSFLPLGNTTLRPYSTQRPTTTPRPSIFSPTTVAQTTTPSMILPSGPSTLNSTSIQTTPPQTPSASDCGSFRNNTLRSPGYPNNYPRNMDCVYRVPIPFDQKLIIYFNFFELERHWNCRYDYLRISNDRNHIIGTYCGVQTGLRVLITSSAAVLTFHSDGSVQFRGFDLSFSFLPLGIFSSTTVAPTTTPSMILPSGPSALNPTSIQTTSPQTPSAPDCGSFRNNILRSPGYPNNYPRNMDCVYRVPIPFDQKLVIYFNFFYLEHHWNCWYDYLRISNDRNYIIGTYCGLQTGRSVLITSSAAVLSFHSDGSVQYRGFDLSFSFIPLGIFSSTTVAPTTTPSMILPSGPSTLNSTSIQTSLPQTPSAPDCGSFRNNTLRSPGYPNDYPRNMDCVYRVPIPFDQKLVINFNFFYLESAGNCVFDYLKISNDRNLTIGTYCGLETGLRVLITSSAAVLSFHSDGSFQYRGFDLSFSFIPLGIFSSTTVAPTTTPSVILPSGPSALNPTSIQTILPQTPSAPDCGSFRNNTLRSPGYPNNYPRNMDCVYRVPIPFDQKLVIYFNFFELERHWNCWFDYLRISNDRNHIIGTYCGLQTGRSVLITSSAAVLSFHSDGSAQYRGFDLSFSFLPLGIFSSTTVASTTTPSVILPSGPSTLNSTSFQTTPPQTPSAPDCGPFRNNTLRSPGYPNYYPRNMDCVYRVPIPFDQKLVIYFNYFYLPYSWNCVFNYLRISNDRNHTIGTYCSWETGRRVLITSSAAVLSFHSDGSFQYRGFDLSFSFIPLGNTTLRPYSTQRPTTTPRPSIFSSITVAPTTTPSVILPSEPSALNSTSIQTTPPQTPSAPDCGSFRNNTLRSPGYPNDYPRNMDCVYRVPIPFDQKLVIYFNFFYLEHHSKCRYDYLRISNDRNHIIGTYCGVQTGGSVLITSSAAVLSFHSDGIVQYRGFDLSFSFLPLGNTTLRPYPNQRPTTTPRPSIFSSTTVAPTTTPSVILPSGPSALNPTSIQTILPQTPSAPDCGSFRNNILRSPGYPNNYPRNMHCVYRVPIPFDQKLIIYFNYFYLESAWNCVYDYLRISNDRNHIIGTYCGLQTGRSVLITSSAAVLSFHSDGVFQYRGFDLSFSFFPLGIFSSTTVAPTTTASVILPSGPSALNPTSIQTTSPQTPSAPDCGSFRNNILRSPGYPNNYPRNMHCVYRVPIPFDQKLVIFFNFFYLESAWNCVYDYLRISNDRNHIIGTYCGLQTGRSVLITSSAAVLSFHSDGVFQYRGFDLSFSFFPLGNTTLRPYSTQRPTTTPRPGIFSPTTVAQTTTPSMILPSGPSTLNSTSIETTPPQTPSASDCGSVQNNTLRSPGYPNNYPSNMDCVYRVPIPLDQELEIYFKDFKLEYSWNYCTFDYLRISNDRNHIIGTYCGVQTGLRVLITSSAAVLSFHSDGSVQYRGFDLSFSFLPLGNTTLRPYSTQRPTTTPRPGIFSSATIEPNTTPSPIASGPSALSPTPPPPPQTPSARVAPTTTPSVILPSEPSALNSTSIQTTPPQTPSAPDCGSFRNNILRSPGYPNNYPRNMDCVYRVPIPFDQKLVIYFNFFDLVYTRKCWFDYLRISNDRNHTIGKYCGVQTGRSVLITGSAVVLSFHSDWIFWIFQNRGFDLHFSFFPLGIFSSATIEPNTTPSPIASGPSALSPTPPPPPPPPPQTPSARDIFALTRVKPNTTTSQIASGPSTLKSTSPQAPPPHRPLPLRSYNSFSRIPPDERRKESVVLSVTGLNISEWHQEMKRNFKKEVARAATEYCSVKQAECRSVLVSSPRWRSSNMTFSPDMVHILPGYPKKSSDDPNVAMIAFYLSLPRESSQSIAVGKDVLTNIVKSNMPSIGRCLGSSIVAVEPLNSPLQEFPTNDDKIREFTAAKIIGASLFGGLFLVIIILVRFVKKKRRPFIFKDNFQPDGKLEALEMKGVPVAFSDASPKSTKWSASTRNQSATSQSINVHPSAFHDHSKSLVNHAHQAERDDSIEPEREVEWLEKSSELWKDQVAASVPSDELNLACLSVVPRDHPESSVNQVCQDSDEEEDKNKRNDAGPLKKSQDSNTVTI